MKAYNTPMTLKTKWASIPAVHFISFFQCGHSFIRDMAPRFSGKNPKCERKKCIFNDMLYPSCWYHESSSCTISWKFPTILFQRKWWHICKKATHAFFPSSTNLALNNGTLQDFFYLRTNKYLLPPLFGLIYMWTLSFQMLKCFAIPVHCFHQFFY